MQRKKEKMTSTDRRETEALKKKTGKSKNEYTSSLENICTYIERKKEVATFITKEFCCKLPLLSKNTFYQKEWQTLCPLT
jgi:hypothetical protein